jgi:imidazole glycerol-phosphate synthase subunit HisH
MRIALIDYRAGNLTSVRKALATVGADFFTPAAASDLVDADAIIVPGVGHFGATANLDAGWRTTIRDLVVSGGRPLLGICLGLQWLFESSEEAPDLPGLGLLAGRCHLLRADGLKVPHVGWNTLAKRRDSRALGGVPDATYAYFTHSFVAPVTGACVATSTHGETFAAVVEQDRVMGVQFHPEKSSDTGLAILRNFLALATEVR